MRPFDWHFARVQSRRHLRGRQLEGSGCSRSLGHAPEAAVLNKRRGDLTNHIKNKLPGLRGYVDFLWLTQDDWKGGETGFQIPSF